MEKGRHEMKLIIGLLTASLLSLSAQSQPSQSSSELVLVGNIPGQYLSGATFQKNQSYPGYVRIRGRLIHEVRPLARQDYPGFIRAQKSSGVKTILLHRDGKNNSEGLTFNEIEKNADVIYPGLINLHNHTKQNNLPVWREAAGQFVNRFEWRDFPPYKKAVSFNVNPWVNFGPAAECATYRWSEMQAMVGGTAYLQGPSSCITSFGIHRVEDPQAYVSQKERVSAPTDLIIPEEFGIVWSELRPLIQGGQSYEQALTATVHKYCPQLKERVTVQNINNEALTIFADQQTLKSSCQQDANLPPGFLRYLSYTTNHPSMANRKKYLSNPRRSALIVHLAEGRRDDAYNRHEYELFDLIGFTKPLVPQAKRAVPFVFVHGTGVPENKFPELAALGIGLVWSPFSNMLLYNETINISAARKAGVVISIGSDWLPTGTRHVLEEVKFAKQYLKMMNQFSAAAGFTDEVLYQMLTENPAKQIDHYEIKTQGATVVEAPVGRLIEGAMGSVIAVKKSTANPYTNLVDASEREINLNVIDGKPVYGNESYIQQYGNLAYEALNVDSDDYAGLKNQSVPRPPMDQKRVTRDPQLLLSHLQTLGRYVKEKNFRPKATCRFEQQKVFVHQSSLGANADREQYGEILSFMQETGLNLDRASDITKILAVNLLTQSRNMLEPEGDPEFALKNMTPLYSCHDEQHQAKLKYYFEQVVGKRNGEFFRNRAAMREIREAQGLSGTTELYDLYK